MRKYSFIFLVFIAMTGCTGGYALTKGKIVPWTPRPLFMSNLPDGDDSHSQGFRDGCNSAIGLIGSGLLRNHDINYDANRGIEDRDYYKGYRQGFNYCTYYTDSDPL